MAGSSLGESATEMLRGDREIRLGVEERARGGARGGDRPGAAAVALDPPADALWQGTCARGGSTRRAGRSCRLT